MRLACIYPHTWVAFRILTRRGCYLHLAVRTSVVLSAFLAVVIVGVEPAVGAIFAFCLISTVLGDEFLARSALCDCWGLGLAFGVSVMQL